jgi:DNA-binding NtrC family response regulator
MTKPSSLPVLTEFLELVLPGESVVMQTVRQQVLEFGLSPLAKTLLLEGPIGAGKSTVARVTSMVKRIAPLTEDEARRHVELTRFDESGRVDLKLMPWYVELALTGLSENLVDAQLFGSAPGAFSDAPDRAGVFEQAKTGRRKAREEPEPGARLTSGVVFLDEIGDLSPAHQAKLLPVLSGGVFYRLGTEGGLNRELQYTGITISASWRPLSKILRPDLYSRISSNRIELPGLGDRMDDFDQILDQSQTIVLGIAKAEIDRMVMVEQADLDRSYWLSMRESMTPLNENARRLLAQVDWSARGNMRGLMAVIQKIIVGQKSPEEAIASVAKIMSLEDHPADAGPALLERLLRRTSDGQGLAGRLREIEVDQRRELQDFLLSDRAATKRLAAALGLDENGLSSQIHQLHRRRTRRGKVGR